MTLMADMVVNPRPTLLQNDPYVHGSYGLVWTPGAKKLSLPNNDNCKYFDKEKEEETPADLLSLCLAFWYLRRKLF